MIEPIGWVLAFAFVLYAICVTYLGTRGM